MIEELGGIRPKSEPNVDRFETDGVYIMAYVDDLLFVGEDNAIARVISKLQELLLCLRETGRLRESSSTVACLGRSVLRAGRPSIVLCPAPSAMYALSFRRLALQLAMRSRPLAIPPFVSPTPVRTLDPPRSTVRVGELSGSYFGLPRAVRTSSILSKSSLAHYRVRQQKRCAS